MNRLKSICMAVFCLLAKEWLWQATSPMTNPEGSHPLLSNEKDTSYWCLFAEREVSLAEGDDPHLFVV